MVREIIAPDKIHNAIDEIAGSQYGSHYSIVYHNLKVLRNMYPQLIKQHLEVNNDTVLFLPFYDSTDRARKLLSKLSGLMFSRTIVCFLCTILFLIYILVSLF